MRRESILVTCLTELAISWRCLVILHVVNLCQTLPHVNLSIELDRDSAENIWSYLIFPRGYFENVVVCRHNQGCGVAYTDSLKVITISGGLVFTFIEILSARLILNFRSSPNGFSSFKVSITPSGISAPEIRGDQYFKEPFAPTVLLGGGD